MASSMSPFSSAAYMEQLMEHRMREMDHRARLEMQHARQQQWVYKGGVYVDSNGVVHRAEDPTTAPMAAPKAVDTKKEKVKNLIAYYYHKNK